MAHPTVLVQSVLLPRLLAAIGAGSVLAASGCGGKTQATNGAVANGVDGAEQTSEPQESSAASTTTVVEPNPPTTPQPEAPPTVAPVDSTTDSTALPVTRPSFSGETTTPSQTELSSAPPSGETTDVTSSESTERTTTEPAMDAGAPIVACEFGQPAQFCLDVPRMESLARYGVGQIPLDPPRSDEEIASGWDVNGCMKHEWVATGCCNPALSPGQPQGDGSCCYIACEGACCGRPFLVDGAALVANIVPSSDWLLNGSHGASRITELDARARRLLCDAWLEDARMEHASVGSFARFSLDLLRLGAPPELLRDSHLAGLDEIEHARIAFSVAEYFSGVSRGPDVLPIENLGVHSLEQAIGGAIIEGCIGETLAAAILTEQAQQCTDPFIASHLKRIAEDELRHAELAWRFVAWSIERHGARARTTAAATFAAALAKLPAPAAPLELTEQQLRAGGRISPQAWSQIVQSVAATVLEPAASRLLASESHVNADASVAHASHA